MSLLWRTSPEVQVILDLFVEAEQARRNGASDAQFKLQAAEGKLLYYCISVGSRQNFKRLVRMAKSLAYERLGPRWLERG